MVVWMVAQIPEEDFAGSADRGLPDRVGLRRCSQLLARHLLETAGLGGPEFEVIYEQSGRPHFQSQPGYSLSISHTKPDAKSPSGRSAGWLVGVAVSSNGRVGFDLESDRPIFQNPVFQSRYFTPGESAAVRSGVFPAQRLWVVKEAIGKAEGVGIQIGFNGIALLNSDSILSSSIEVNTRRYFIHVRSIDGVSVGLVSESGEEPVGKVVSASYSRTSDRVILGKEIHGD